MEELGFTEMDTPIIYVDSQSALQLIHNPVFHDKTKHIQGKMHCVRKIAQEGGVTFTLHGILRTRLLKEYLPTKPLCAEKEWDSSKTLINHLRGCVVFELAYSLIRI